MTCLTDLDTQGYLSRSLQSQSSVKTTCCRCCFCSSTRNMRLSVPCSGVYIRGLLFCRTPPRTLAQICLSYLCRLHPFVATKIRSFFCPSRWNCCSVFVSRRPWTTWWGAFPRGGSRATKSCDVVPTSTRRWESGYRCVSPCFCDGVCEQRSVSYTCSPASAVRRSGVAPEEATAGSRLR